MQNPQDLHSKLIDEADALIIYIDKEGKVCVCNKMIERLCAKKKEEMLGRYWIDVVCGDTKASSKQQVLKAIIEDTIKYKRPNNFEGLVTDKDNYEHLISWSITPILSGNQELEGVFLIGNDITELKAGEASYKKIDETLKNIFSNIKEYALYAVNLDGNITYYGMGSELMFGWQKNEIIFKHINNLHIPEDTRAKLPWIFDQVKREDQYEAEMNLMKKDGSSIPVILSVSKFLDAEGKLIGFIFIAKDITERKKLEYQIMQSEKLAAIGQLAAGVAHEINNPLFVISGRLEMVLEQRELTQGTRETLVVINAQVERIRKLVDQLLKFSRKAPPKVEPLNINEVIETVLPLLNYHKLPASTIGIIKELQKDLPLVNADQNQLQEVFLNLFINAHQSMQEGGNLIIKTRRLKNNCVEIRISDTGCGIPQENLKNIFMPFFSTKKDGTGLGLSICYNIIKNHNGSIEIDSQPNKGTTFTITLPSV